MGGFEHAARAFQELTVNTLWGPAPWVVEQKASNPWFENYGLRQNMGSP